MGQKRTNKHIIEQTNKQKINNPPIWVKAEFGIIVVFNTKLMIVIAKLFFLLKKDIFYFQK
jgi:hypothetical protein